ncbi:MAG: peptidase T [Oscillospiraceae bacterium]|nr:peptidase T [Oscillospiraceae bacterium]
MKAYERLLKYVQYPTASDENSETCPSTSEQRILGMALCDEMKEMGISNVVIDDNGYVYGEIPASSGCENAPVIGFIAHMDVVAEVPCVNIKPQIVDYQGGDVLLNEEQNIWLSCKDFPEMNELAGQHLIVTDGTTLLGADDKNGVAEILTAAEELLANPEIKHGKIMIGFTPDEEIGRGANRFDLERFGADYAYTLDGGAFGEVECETFNAAHAHIVINGVSVHPGSAKDKMINASIVAMEFNSLLPAVERPEHTEKYEGFYHITGMKGTCDNAEIYYIIRDHDADKLAYRVEYIKRAADEINRRYGEGTVVAETGFDYKNMSVIIKDHWHLIENAEKAIRALGTEPVTNPVRGGTDGCVLSFMGLPCPNLGTGGYNFHGKFEFASIEQMDKAVEMIKNIAVIYGEQTK